MPELPEVEVVKRSLKSSIRHLTIKKVTINTNKLRYLIKKKNFNKIINKKILSIKRRSKYILINLSSNLSLLAHLGMTGKFIIENNTGIKNKTSFYYEINKNEQKHNHLIFHLSQNKKLIYNDVRKFGFIKIINSKNIKKNDHIRLLGPEPLSNNFNLKYFKNCIVTKKRKLKDLLMDQKFVSGLGNIYVNEVLFLSKLDPTRPVNTLKSLDIAKILNFIKKILKVSIKEGGSSIKNFNNSNGKNGEFQQQFNVYGREGEKCLKKQCKELIKKINISNRSSFFCASCQK
jgi:formamidopyrimidine-DNA glycosylase|tara:strand:- start:7342 stop:8208 length:867 start_codon:yes stop_codon:yes gene_type:complete